MSALIGWALCAAMTGKRTYAYITTRFYPVEEKVSIAFMYSISAAKKSRSITTVFAEEKRTFSLNSKETCF